jgi:hypothetical protein
MEKTWSARVAQPKNKPSNKKGLHFCSPFLFGALGWIRTSDPLVRSQVLYPTELRAQAANYRENVNGRQEKVMSFSGLFYGDRETLGNRKQISAR